MKYKILIVDDEKEMLESFRKLFLKKTEYIISLESTYQSAVTLLKSEKFDLLVADLKIGKESGIELCKKALEFNPQIKVFVVSGYGTIESGIKAIKAGAIDFIEKPFTSELLFRKIKNVLQSLSITDEENTGVKNFHGMIYKSEAMQKVVDLIKRVAKSDLTILIEGDSGTGKELAARALHRLSNRSTKPFVPVNCGALPENLFESELFGFEKGSFTGAATTKPGLLEFANQGTFFFDEVSETPLNIQVKLLRMIEEKKVRRLGGQKEIELDLRIISATNQHLEEAVKEKRMREDFYYRLNAFTINIPPLRERREDILPLFYHYSNEFSKKHGIAKKSLSENAREALNNYDWPGNVRELINVVNKIYYLNEGEYIPKENLPLPNISCNNIVFKEIRTLPYRVAKERILEKFEIDYLTYNLSKCKGNITKTAEQCQIDRRSIHRLIQKYNIIFKD